MTDTQGGYETLGSPAKLLFLTTSTIVLLIVFILSIGNAHTSSDEEQKRYKRSSWFDLLYCRAQQ